MKQELITKFEIDRTSTEHQLGLIKFEHGGKVFAVMLNQTELAELADKMGFDVNWRGHEQRQDH